VRGETTPWQATELYGVETRRLNEQVRRNKQRFPADFIFEVSDQEARALKMSVFVVRAFVQYRTVLSSTRELAERREQGILSPRSCRR
jgi:hypothetical protein